MLFLDVNREARSEDVLMKSTIESLKKTHLKMNSTITLLLRSVVKKCKQYKKRSDDHLQINESSVETEGMHVNYSICL